MPTPSPWAVGVAAPSYTNPYQELEAIELGASSGGLAAGEVTPPSRKLSGSWKEALDPKEPAFWFFLALLVLLGVINFTGKGASIKVPGTGVGASLGA